jgi:hypothetical protein
MNDTPKPAPSEGPKKIFRTVELALEACPPENWTTSKAVSRSLLECPRVKGIVRQHLMKKGVSTTQMSECIADVALVTQMNVLPKLDKITSVYYVIYRVAELIAMNLGRKRGVSTRDPVISFSDVIFAGESSEDAEARIISTASVEDGTDEIHVRLDKESAQRRLAAKLEQVGWPSDIERERIRRGRPEGSTKAKKLADKAQVAV